MRLVLDTDVLVAAFRSERGASRALLLAALDAKYTLLVSTALWLEYDAVLTRPEQLAAMHLTIVEVRDALAALAAVAEPVLIHFLWRPILTDANDEHVLDLAMNGRADLLVTFNKGDFTEASRTFQIEVVTPSAALGKLR
jgi:putative PIN family toxin of toxin-antitoxin system